MSPPLWLWQASSQGPSQECNFCGKEWREKGGYLLCFWAGEYGTRKSGQLWAVFYELVWYLAVVQHQCRLLLTQGEAVSFFCPLLPYQQQLLGRYFPHGVLLKGRQNIFNCPLLLDFCVNNLYYGKNPSKAGRLFTAFSPNSVNISMHV